MLKGTYVFYEDGKEIIRSSNLITKFGKRFLTNFMAGNVSFSNKNMALGIATSTEYPIADSNSRLGFEFHRMPVDFGTTNIQPDGVGGYTYSVIYKSTIPQNVSGIINEIGIYPAANLSANFYDSKIISDFENNLIWFDSNYHNLDPQFHNPPIVNSVSTVMPRIGNRFIQVSTSQALGSKEYFASVNNFDISGYSVNDTLDIAFYQPDINVNVISVKFYSSDTDYYQADFTGADNTTGHKILQTALDNMLNNPVGTPDATAISKIGIKLTSDMGGASTIYLDGLRINDEDTFDPAYGLISRSIISGGLNKVLGRQVDVEYRLELF